MSGTIEIRWRRLRRPLAICAAAALAGGAAAAAAWWHGSRIAERMNAAETRLEAARGRYSALAEEERTRRRFGPLYRRLAAAGRLGEEQPARWAEAAGNAAGAVLSAHHRIGAPHVVQRAGPVEVRATDMSLDLEMLHEADLPVFLAALDREAPGLFTISGCRLLRTDAAGPSPASVGASCRVRWQSVLLSGVEPDWRPAAGTDDGGDAGGMTGADGGAGSGDGPGAGSGGWSADLADPPRETFGRIFTTAAERAAIESAALAARTAAREAPEAPAETPENAAEEPAARRPEPASSPARWVRVGGVVARSGRSVYAWVDGRRVAFDGSHPEAAAPAKAAASAEAEALGVRLHAGTRSITVRPGQRFDPRTGAVSDPIHRPEERFERARSLRDSSRAPLTDPRALEQN